MMIRTKPLFLFLFLFLSSVVLFAQGEVNLVIQVNDSKQKPLSGASIALVETTLGTRLEKTADAMGKATFSITEGKLWKLYVNNFYMDREIDVPEIGRTNRTMALTYNPELVERHAQQTFDRFNYSWTPQTYTGNEAPLAGKAMLKVKVMSRAGYPQKGVTVRLVHSTTKTGFTAVTGTNGMANFMADMGKSYDVDVAEVLNISYVDVKNKPNIVLTSTVQYDAPKISETRYGDTIVQRILKEEAASGRAFYTLTIHRFGEGPAGNETVYLQEIHGKDVYVGYTDDKGEVKFLLPLGKKYMVHFNFEKDVDVVDLSKVFGYVNGGMELTYRPNPKLENPELFIPKKEELFLVEFERFLQKQYPEPVKPDKVGLFLRWGNKFNAQSTEALLEIGYTAKGDGMQMPGNYSFVIDRSGSMAGYYRIEMLKLSLIELVKMLSPNDFVSVIAYDDDMQIIFPHQKLGANKEVLIKAIEAIEAGGGTDMLASMKQGYEFVMSKYAKNQNNRIILLSDGYDNNQPEVLEAAQAPYNDKVSCTSVGVGEDYNYALLKILSEKGRGVLHHVADSADFRKVFLQGLVKEMKPVAYDVKLEVMYNDKLVAEHVYGRTPIPGSTNPLKYQLPNLYDGANEVALAVFSLKKADPSIQSEPIIVRIRYKEKLDGPELVVEQKIYPEWEEGSGKLKMAVEKEQKKLYAVAEINRALKVMAESYAAGDNAKAQKVLEETITRMRDLYPLADDKDVKDLIASMEGYLEAFKNLAKKKELQKKKKGS